MKDVLDIEIRRKIYNIIKKDPGLHARKISEILHITGQLADYHLQYLEKKEVITTVKEEGYRRFYIKGQLGSDDRRRISILRREIPLRIVLYLLKNPYSQHKEILKIIDVAPSTLSYHLFNLIKHDIVEISKESGIKKYKIKNEEEIIKHLIQYKPYSRIEGMKETWIDLKWTRVTK